MRGKITPNYEPDAEVLRDFRDFLDHQRVRVPDEYWTPDQDYLKLRIKSELFSLVFGLAAGDEVQTRGDPQVESAAELFPKIPSVLKQPSPKSAISHAGRGDVNPKATRPAPPKRGR